MERAHRDDTRLAPAIEEPVTTREQPSEERFVGGDTPEVASTTTASAGRTASELAFEEDANVRELKAKVSALVNAKFGGDYKAAFDHYSTADIKDGKVGRDELKALLSDAGVGNGLTRGAWASGIIGKLDTDGDEKIGWDEFQKVTGGAATA